jgi:hypothetical protein
MSKEYLAALRSRNHKHVAEKPYVRNKDRLVRRMPSSGYKGRHGLL